MVAGQAMVAAVELNRSAVKVQQVTPIARLLAEYSVIVVPANSPYKTMADVIKDFKANPGAVSWGAGSAGSTEHLLIGLIAKAVGVEGSKINYIAFKGGGEAVPAIIGGHVKVGASGLGEFAEHIKTGKMRALAVSAPTAMDGIPSLKEQGIDVVFGNWRGVWGGPGITPQQRDELVKMVQAATETAEWKAMLAKMGWTPVVLTGDAYAQVRRRRVEEPGRAGGLAGPAEVTPLEIGQAAPHLGNSNPSRAGGGLAAGHPRSRNTPGHRRAVRASGAGGTAPQGAAQQALPRAHGNPSFAIACPGPPSSRLTWPRGCASTSRCWSPRRTSSAATASRSPTRCASPSPRRLRCWCWAAAPHYFPKLRQILVYPAAFFVDRVRTEPSGVMQEQRQVLSGESWSQGQVILSWEDVLAGAAVADDGRNVVIHEFAHQLDQETGHANGAPRLVTRERYARWSHVLGREFARLSYEAAVAAARPSSATTAPRTRASSSRSCPRCSSSRRRGWRCEYPELYRELRDYYRVDPQSLAEGRRRVMRERFRNADERR